MINRRAPENIGVKVGFITEEGSHGDRVVFCSNDYDDVCIGPAVWDLARFLVSLMLAAEYCRRVLAGEYASEERKGTAGLRAIPRGCGTRRERLPRRLPPDLPTERPRS